MDINAFINDMIDFYKGSLSDIEHSVKVTFYARLIGECEKLDSETLDTLIAAAVVHDIACPLCREKYGRADGYLQEKESEGLVRAFFSKYALDDKTLERIIFLVTHHHTYENVAGKDWRILLEADYLVNAVGIVNDKEAFTEYYEKIMKTETGRRVFDSVYSRVQKS